MRLSCINYIVIRWFDRFTFNYGRYVMTKFTKGEWVENEGDSCSKELVITTLDRYGCHQGTICEMDIYFDGEHGEAQQANAHLIASAPNMYAALEAISKGEGLHPGTTIESILLKARGE